MAEKMKVVRLSREVRIRRHDIFKLPAKTTHIALGRGRIVLVETNFKGEEKTNKWSYIETKGALFATFSCYFLQNRSGFHYSSLTLSKELAPGEKAISIEKNWAMLEEGRKKHVANIRALDKSFIVFRRYLKKTKFFRIAA